MQPSAQCAHLAGGFAGGLGAGGHLGGGVHCVMHAGGHGVAGVFLGADAWLIW